MLVASLRVFVGKEEVDGAYVVVDEGADRLAVSDDSPVIVDLVFLLFERTERQPKRTHAAFSRVDLSARTGDRHPHRRMRLLIGLGQYRAGRHRECAALVAKALLRPHLRDAAHELVPG